MLTCYVVQCPSDSADATIKILSSSIDGSQQGSIRLTQLINSRKKIGVPQI